MKEIITELKQYMETVQTFDQDAAQDGQALHAYLINLTQMMARANYLMAEYGRLFREQKKAAYLNLIASQAATQKFFAVSLAKDFVDSQCAETGYVYDLAERLSRLCSHTLDAVRSIVSSLKSERAFANYS